MWKNQVAWGLFGLTTVVHSVRALVRQYKTRHEYQKYDPHAIYAANVLMLLLGLALLALTVSGLLKGD